MLIVFQELFEVFLLPFIGSCPGLTCARVQWWSQSGASRHCVARPRDHLDPLLSSFFSSHNQPPPFDFFCLRERAIVMSLPLKQARDCFPTTHLAYPEDFLLCLLPSRQNCRLPLPPLKIRLNTSIFKFNFFILLPQFFEFPSLGKQAIRIQPLNF